jgi:hypothetical protein
MDKVGNVVACIWDFDKTLIPGYMQAPLFREYGIDEAALWKEIDALPARLQKKGIRLSDTLAYLNYILELVRSGRLPGLSKAKLACYGEQLTFYPGIPELFSILREDVESDERCRVHGITLEHYIISSGHGEIIRGSRVAPLVDGIFACEFLENEIADAARIFFERAQKMKLAAREKDNISEEMGTFECYENTDQIAFEEMDEIAMGANGEIKQIACVIDNTQKTRCLFEINKGSNRNSAIDVNATVDNRNRRVPFHNMIYIADGPSDIPAFSLVRSRGGKAFAVYDPRREKEFVQNDRMLEDGRIDAYGPADYRLESPTARWLRMHVKRIAQRMLDEREQLAERLIGKPPEHFL